MALKPVTVGGQTVYVDDKNTVYTGTADFKTHGDEALSKHLFQNTGQNLNSFRTQQTANQEKDFLGRFNQAITNRPSLGELSSNLEQEYGIPQARENFSGLSSLVGDITNQVRSLPQRVEGETRGFDVNANQLAQIKEARQQPLMQNLAEAGTNLSSVGSTLNMLNSALTNRLGFEMQDREDALMPLQMEASFLSDRLAREAAQYSREDEQEFDMILEKMRSNQQLTMAEMLRANELADQESEFARQKELLTMQTNENIRQSNATKSDNGLGSSTQALLDKYLQSRLSRGNVNPGYQSFDLNKFYNF